MNLLRNSSFEKHTVGKFPDYWGPQHLEGTWWKESYFQVDEKIASPIRGAKVLRIEKVPEWKDAKAEASWLCLETHKTYTLSCYIKAESEGYDAVIEMGQFDKNNPVKKIKVGKEWQRYSLTGIPIKGSWFGRHWSVMSVAIKPVSLGKLWIAAPMLEFGEKASAYSPAPSDVFEPSTIEKQVSFPETLCRTVKVQPSLLDFIKNSPDEKEFTGELSSNINGSKITHASPTFFQVFNDDDNLYIYAKCVDTGISGKMFSGSEGQEWKIFSEDSLYCYIKPDFRSGDYFLFGTNPDGKRLDSAWYWFEWGNNDWKVETIKENTYWAAKFTIPFYRIFEITGNPGFGTKIGLNIMRFEKVPESEDASSLRKSIWFWSPDRSTRLPCGFGKISGVDTAEIHAVRIKECRLAFNCLNKTDIIAEIDYCPNLHGKGLLQAGLITPAGKKYSSSMSFELDGKAKTLILNSTAPKWESGIYNLSVCVMDASGGPIGKYEQKVYVSDSLRLLDNEISLMSELSFYTGEKNAELLLASNSRKNYECNFEMEGINLPEINGGKRIVLNAGTKIAINVPVSEMPIGKHRIKVTAYLQGGDKPETYAFEIIQKITSAPSGVNEVKINRFKNMLVKNGKPVIVWADRADSERFNTTFYGEKPGKGMMWCPKGAGWGKDLDASKWVSESQTVNSDIIAYMFHDEPHPSQAEKIVRQYAGVKAADPYKPAFYFSGAWPFDAMQCAPSEIADATDIIAMSFYPWGCSGASTYSLGQKDFYNLRNTIYLLHNMEMLVKRLGLAGWMNLSSYTAGENVHGGTPEQHRCMIFLGLVHGIRCFSEWGGRNPSDSVWDCFATIKKELDCFADILGDRQSSEMESGANGNIHYSLWKRGSEFYLIIANPTSELATAKFSFPKTMKKIRSTKNLFDGDAAQNLDRGILTISLPAYGSSALILTDGI